MPLLDDLIYKFVLPSAIAICKLYLSLIGIERMAHQLSDGLLAAVFVVKIPRNILLQSDTPDP